MNETDLIGLAGGAFGCFFGLLFLILFVAIWWKLVAKTGNTPLLALLLLIPLANIGLLLFLAFSEWPIERRIRELEERLSGG